MWFLTGVAMAADCAATPIPAEELSLDGATAVAVKGIVGSVRLVGDDGPTLRATGTVCSGEADVALVRDGNVVRVTVRARQAEGLELLLTVPRTVLALTVADGTGPVASAGLATKLAVVNSVGPVAVRDAASLRVQNVTGPVSATDVHGDVLVDHVVGPVGVTGVAGDLVVTGGVTAVQQSGVQGRVLLP